MDIKKKNKAIGCHLKNVKNQNTLTHSVPTQSSQKFEFNLNPNSINYNFFSNSTKIPILSTAQDCQSNLYPHINRKNTQRRYIIHEIST